MGLVDGGLDGVMNGLREKAIPISPTPNPQSHPHLPCRWLKSHRIIPMDSWIVLHHGKL